MNDRIKQARDFTREEISENAVSNSSNYSLLERYGSFSSTLKNYLGDLTQRIYFSNPINWKTEEIDLKDYLHKTFFIASKQAAQDGIVYIDITKTDDNNPIFTIADTGEYESIGDRTIWAKLNLTSFIKGEVEYTMIVEYDLENIQRSVEAKDLLSGIEKEMSWEAFTKEFKINLPKTEKNTYGIIPVLIVENIDTKDGFGRSDLDGYETLLDQLDKTWIRYNWEIEVNKSTILLNKTNGGLGGNKNNSDKNNAFNDILEDSIVKVWENVSFGDGNKNPIQSIDPNMSSLSITSQTFAETLERILAMTFNPAMTNKQNTSNEGRIEFTQSQSNELIGLTFRQNKWNREIKKMFRMLNTIIGLDIEEVKLSPIMIQDKKAVMRSLMELFTNGVITLDETRETLGKEPLTEEQNAEIINETEIKTNETTESE